jgi:hypothetical protein
MNQNELSYALKIASAFEPEMIGQDLANDVMDSISIGLKARAVFKEGDRPHIIFQAAVAKAITDIAERSSLLGRFLRDGPYERKGKIPKRLRNQRLTDEETARAITFIYSHMVNCFKGQLAELLAIGPCVLLVEQLVKAGKIPSTSRLFVGDSILLSEEMTARRKRAADLHIIVIDKAAVNRAIVNGVIEVKSYACSMNYLRKQLERHKTRISRAGSMNILKGGHWKDYIASYSDNILSVGISAANWKIPRTFSFTRDKGKTLLNVDPPEPPTESPRVNQVGQNDWHIVLKWSDEALASVAYDMTFWYMEKLGEIVYSQNIPLDWKEMTPGEAGRNAAKMMLYYAILRCPTRRSQQRAIALYNSYGFGYALGMNFRDVKGYREMLWYEDLCEIEKTGVTKHGCRIRH